MTLTVKRLLQFALAIAIGFGSLFLNEKISLIKPQSLVSRAEAIIGRPLTPLSYAGVARRTTRRAVAAGAIYGAPVVVAPVPVPVVPVRRCVQAVDPYGRIYTRCY